MLTDIRMPPTWQDEGIQAAQRLRDTSPQVGVIVLSQFTDPGYAIALLKSGSARRPWQVRSRMLVPGPRLPSCATIDDIDVTQTSLRRQSHISLDENRGSEAERLIARAAERAGSVGHCYKGPPPPEGFVPGG